MKSPQYTEKLIISCEDKPLRPINHPLREIFCPRLLRILVVCAVGVALSAGCSEKPREVAQSDEMEAQDCRRESALTAQMLRKSTHLKSGLSLCYIVTEQLTVGTDVNLKIDPGVKILFEDDAGLTVHEGSLSARGTAEQPIIFSARRPEPGAWAGIRFMDSSSADNILEHVVIEYGGATPGFKGVKPANLMLDDYYGEVSLSVKDTTLAHSGQFGFYAEAGTSAQFMRNRLIHNEAGAAHLSPVFLDLLDAESHFSPNPRDRVVLSGEVIDNQRLKWPGLSVPYEVLDDLELSGNTIVEIEPGATFKFAENTGLSVFRARLSARGKKDRPITFTGINQTPGYWKGIRYLDANSVDNALEHVAIRYGGAHPTYKGVESANLMLDDYYGKVRLKLHNSELSHSANYGLYAEEKSELDFGHNRLVDNGRAAALLHPLVVGALDAQSRFRSAEDTDKAADDPAAPPNYRGGVEVMGENLDSVEVRWPALDTNYLIRGDILVRDDAHLSISPGATLAFKEGAGISVYRARLSAKGTSDAPILFTGQTPKPGLWKGIHLVDTSSVENIFEHVTIEYGGSLRTFKGAEPANLMFDDYYGLVSATLNEVTSRESGGAAFHIEPGAQIRSARCASIRAEGSPALTAESKSLRRACRGGRG